MSARRLEPRERRTVAIGATVSVVALALAFGILPTVRRWADREAAIDGMREQVARLRGLVTYRDRVVAAAAGRDNALARMPVRILRDRTPALVASQLQGIVQAAARASQVGITRLEVSATTDSAGATRAMMPVAVSAVSDIYGLAEFLQAMQHGPRLLEIRELSVTPNPVLRGELLLIALVVRAPYLLEP